MRRLAIVGTAAAVGVTAIAVAVGAGGGGEGSPVSSPYSAYPGVEHATRAARPALARFASCERFLSHVRRRAIAQTGPWGLGGVRPMPLAAPVAEDSPVASSPMRAAAPAAGVDFSGTNVQEAGVDEPDLVETDGRTVFAIAAGGVEAVDVTAGAPRRIGALALKGVSPAGLLLMGDRLVVIGDASGAVPLPATSRIAEMAVPAYGPPVTVVVALDVSDPARPREVSRVRAEGGMVAARAAGGTVRLVVSGSAAPRVAQTSPASDTATARRAAQRANRRAVERAPAGAWLPRVTVRDAATGTTVRRGVPCDAVSRPTQNAGLGTITVLTIGVGQGLTLTDTDTILTDGEVVYASPSALYVATPRWAAQVDGAEAPPRGATQIHALDTSDPAQTVYRASGVVAGYPLNQFSLSEHEGHLRVATTEQPDWWQPEDEAEPGESRVTVLAESGGRLVRTGEVRGLGRGERIYAVRFLGDRGYVVTFRETDPLYALDLSDPAAPALRGELKIPGFSSYLHPIDDTTLIGVGQAADSTGRTQGAQVSLFDVSDPTKPARIAQRSLQTDWSEAESDHHAFLWWPASKLLVLPVQAYGGPGRRAFLGAVGLDVDRATGITPLARIAHPGDPDIDWAPVRRSLVVGTTLYTVSDTGIMGSDLGTLAPRGWAAFG